MTLAFSPTQITFDGFGTDGTSPGWIRFRTGGRGNPKVIVQVADVNTGSNKLWRKFGDCGLVLSPADKKAILAKIQEFSGSLRFMVVTTPGWSLGYVSPNKVFGAPSAIVERQFGDLDFAKYRSSGSLSDWQDNVLSLCANNSRLMFAVLCAFTGPVLEILGAGSFGFQLFGPSSIGKTIVLIIADSVWGCRVGATLHLGFLATWVTTPEGVESYGREHKDGFLLMDESRLGGNNRQLGNLVSTFIMRLAQGTTKNRLIRVGSGDWRLVYLGSSNLSLAEMFAAADLDFDDAYRVRFPDVPADADRGFGVCENIHGFPNAADFAQQVHANAITYFGIAGEHFLERLARDRHYRRNWLRSGLQREVACYRDAYPVSSAADGRVADNFARVFAAGVLAKHYGIIGWSRKEIRWAVRRCELAHQRWAAQSQAKLDPIAVVRSYVAANLADFRKVPDPAISDDEFNKAPGFVYARPGETEYVLPAAALGNLSGILSSQHIASTLAAQGLLVRSGDKYVSKVPIRDSSTTGRKFAYRIRGAISAEY